MSRSIISEGKTTNEAIENGLKQLNVTKNMVDIKEIESENKRSFFSILTPRVVKVQLTVKEGKVVEEEAHKEKVYVEASEEDIKTAKENVEKFLNDFVKKLPLGTIYNISTEDQGLIISIKGDNIGFLIGYRGETLYAMQSVISAIANKNTENKVRILIDIAGYKEKREKTLEELADKKAEIVIKTRKSVTLEPMKAYERKIIHSRLQQNDKVTTQSIGEEPKRRIVISLK